jgi:hypothetical protein
MEHQYYNGKKFYQDKKTGYWISTACPKIRAHVWVWKSNHGDIEKGLHIHHKDGDKSNNLIENLECITVKEHFSKHRCEERDALNLIHVENIRPLTKEWHASEEGLEWHKKHGIKTWEERNSFTITCKKCGKIAETKTFHQDFCSNACKSSWRRKEGLDNEERECVMCQTKFKANKYAKTRCCSRKCGCLLGSQKH